MAQRAPATPLPNVLERTLMRNCLNDGPNCVFHILIRLPCVQVNCHNPASGETPLLLATIATNFHKAKELLARGADCQHPNIRGLTALRSALNRRRHDMLHLMCFQHKADINHYGPHAIGYTALHQACMEDNHLGARVLLYCGANPDLQMRDPVNICRYLSSLDLAVITGNVDIVRDLLLYNCKPFPLALLSQSRTHSAVRVWKELGSRDTIARMLIEAGCPLYSFWIRQRPRMPAESSLKKWFLQAPSLKRLCRTVIRKRLNERQDWRKGYSVRYQVMNVMAYYRQYGVPFATIADDIQAYLLMSDLGPVPEAQLPESDPDE
ncbi:hypothetical protein ACOMHN_022099 [Nucella lapillus]